MLYVTFVLNPLLMLALPVLLGMFVARRLGQSWRLFFAGAATFVASQVVHLPLNAWVNGLAQAGRLPAPPEPAPAPAAPEAPRPALATLGPRPMTAEQLERTRVQG